MLEEVMTTEHGVDKRATAIHEAGHAVIGCVLGLLCGGATIIQDEDSAGHAITNDPWAILSAWETRGKYRETETAFRARIIAFMAGREAEIALLSSSQGGDGDDQYQIALMADAELCDDPEDWARWEPRLRRQTRRLIAHHRDTIERVAEVLLEHGTLEPDEIDRLVNMPSLPAPAK